MTHSKHPTSWSTSNTDVDQLIARIERMPDHDIVKALATPEDYTVEAMAVYESEAKRRGIRSDAIRHVATQEAQKKKDRVAGTWSFKGIGERLHGMRAFRADGSYQTTKWFIFIHFPIYPISTLRVRDEEQERISVVDVLPIDWRQVLDTYCFVAISVGGVIGFIRLFEQHSIPYREWLTLAILVLPFLFLRLVRRRAQAKALQRRDRQNPSSPP